MVMVVSTKGLPRSILMGADGYAGDESREVEGLLESLDVPVPKIQEPIKGQTPATGTVKKAVPAKRSKTVRATPETVKQRIMEAKRRAKG